MYHASLHKIPTQVSDSLLVFEGRNFEKERAMINKMPKSWDENTIEDLKQVCPKQEHDFFLDCCCHIQIYLD